MFIAAIVSAAVGIVLLVAAIISGSSATAFAAIVVAIVGSVLLARDWLRERKTPQTTDVAQAGRSTPEADDARDDAFKPEMFEPDISYEEAVESADDTDDLDLDVDGER